MPSISSPEGSSQSKKKIRFQLMAVFAFAALVIYMVFVDSGGQGLRKGEKAPDFSLPSVSETTALYQWSEHHTPEKLFLIHFWATWCTPCVAEMPKLDLLQKRFSREQFEVLAISLDEDVELVKTFMQEKGLTLHVLWNREADVADLYGTYRLPESYLVDGEGVVVEKYLGDQDWTEESMIGEISGYF